MTLSIWLSLLTVCILGAISPGPSLAVVARHSLTGGRLHGIVATWGHSVSVGLYALMTILGLALVMQESPMLFKMLTYGGSAYLMYLGIKSLRSKGGVAASFALGKQASIKRAALDGLAISLFNPKLALFFLALFSQFVHAGSEFFSQFVLVVTPMIVDGLWFTLITCILSYPRLLNTLRRRARQIDQISGCVLIVMAFRVLWVR